MDADSAAADAGRSPGPDPAVALGRRLVEEATRDLGPGDRVLVACSGGADSLALAACAGFVAARSAWDVAGLVVDHGLQPGSAQGAERAAAQLDALGVPGAVQRVRVGSDGGPEAAARAARRAALLARGGEAVLLGHTLDDQAETVLLGLGRGSGPRALDGMRGVDGPWRRPFLRLRRGETERICRCLGLDWWRDPHNDDPAFRRVRVRHELLPLMEDVLAGGVAEALARTADLIRDDADLLDRLAAEVSDPCRVGVLAALPSALRSRCLRRVALEAGARADELTAGHVAELDRLVTAWRGQRRVELPGAVSAVRDQDVLRFGATPVAG